MQAAADAADAAHLDRMMPLHCRPHKLIIAGDLMRGALNFFKQTDRQQPNSERIFSGPITK